ncbi:MAG: hypothetical protein RLZZ214_1882 [Verrucomicrobiota bacterium]|jgi:hypothetical protein
MQTPSNQIPPSTAGARRNRGFALVVTLSLMILLTVIAVGLLTLSGISLRSSSQGAGAAMARANARMALMLAIGELQKQSGLDTRITARADVLDVNNPPVAGVWKSWEGTDHELTGGYQGRPISPGNYATKKKDRFLGWLTSGDPVTATTLPNTTKGAGKAILVGDFTVGKGADREKLQIHLTPSQIVDSKQKGAFAWWVGGENQKARLPKPYEPSEDTSARWAANLKSHSVVDPEPFRMDDLLTDATPANKAITLKLGDLVAKPGALQVSREYFHDLSASSTGLLTNSATGGWKKDLSLLTENWAQAGTSNLPFFRVKPGEDILGNMPTSANPLAAKSMLYPWSAYRGKASDNPIAQHGAVTSWENLKDFALAYRGMGMNIPASGTASMSSRSVAIDGDSYNFLHKVRVLPVIARVQWVFSYWAAKTTGTNYEPRLLLTPTITMWNPYNVQLTTAALEFRIGKPLPVALKFNVGGVQNNAYNNLNGGTINNTPALDAGPNLYYQINSPFTLKPGEARIFSPQGTARVAPATRIALDPGYRTGGGHYFALKNDAGVKMVSVGAASIKTDARFDTTYEDTFQGQASFGVGIYLNMQFGTSRHLAYRMDYETPIAQSVYPPLTGMAMSPSLADIEAKPSPFLTTIFGARMASRTHIPAKGFVQSSSLVNFTAMGNKDLAEATIARKYGGTSHPVNSPFDYSFEKVYLAGDTVLPQADDATNRGYIVTGFTSAEGLSRCVIGELPLRPLVSLAELQNWDLRYENPIPPFAYNLIGNSDATPLLPANAVVNAADSALGTNLQHDDSYCANHLLFDDWIFSSISPDPTTFGTTGRTLKQNFTDFITGSKPLANRAYQPIIEDSANAANFTTIFNDQVNKPNSWKTIASRLEVEGMFNVNSTSVTAWRALLGHARNQKIPYINDTGAAWSVALSDKRDHAFSRFGIAGDVEAKEQGSSGGFPEAAEFSGYRVFDDPLLDALAAEIVNQVRLRGPFLSLSEFINRQLSSGDLALAGTIQAALNQISKSPATNPYSGILAMNLPESSATPAGNPEYKFPDAAVGQISYGLPGWTRQADILRPLAPILSARDDTFTLRAYGDSRDAAGKIIATAVCEAVVRRTRDFVDNSDKADITTLPTSAVNQTFGRRYQLVSFRWLDAGEI